MGLSKVIRMQKTRSFPSFIIICIDAPQPTVCPPAGLSLLSYRVFAGLARKLFTRIISCAILIKRKHF